MKQRREENHFPLLSGLTEEPLQWVTGPQPQVRPWWVADHSSGTNSLALLAKYTSHTLPFRGQRLPSVRESQTVTDRSCNLLQATLVDLCRLEGSWQETYSASKGTNGDSTP